MVQKEKSKIYVNPCNELSKQLILKWHEDESVVPSTIGFTTKEGSLIRAYCASEKLLDFLKKTKIKEQVFFRVFEKSDKANIPDERFVS